MYYNKSCLDLEGIHIPQASCLIVNVYQYFIKAVKGIISAYLPSPACRSVNLITRSMNIILNDYERARLFDKLIFKRHGDPKPLLNRLRSDFNYDYYGRFVIHCINKHSRPLHHL